MLKHRVYAARHELGTRPLLSPLRVPKPPKVFAPRNAKCAQCGTPFKRSRRDATIIFCSRWCCDARHRPRWTVGNMSPEELQRRYDKLNEAHKIKFPERYFQIPGEIWADLVGCETTHQISNWGRVRRHKSKIQARPGMILKQQKCIKGYMSVSLKIDDIRRPYRVGRLVAQTFIPNPENKPETNHLNGIKHDNRVENLEWCTGEENFAHAQRTGLV